MKPTVKIRNILGDSVGGKSPSRSSRRGPAQDFPPLTGDSFAFFSAVSPQIKDCFESTPCAVVGQQGCCCCWVLSSGHKLGSSEKKRTSVGKMLPSDWAIGNSVDHFLD